MPVPEEFVDLHFPAAGIDLSRAFGQQPNRPVTEEKKYARSTIRGINVRGFEAIADRVRGGSRAGFVKYVPARVNDDFIIQELRPIVTSGIDPPGGSVVQPSQGGRVVTLVAVSQGEVFVVNPGDTAWVAANNATGESPPLNFTGLVYSAANQQKLWMVDGTNYVVYNPATNTLNLWTPTAGTLPIDEQNNTARLICTWRGRTVLSGLIKDPQNWFMSKVSDPLNWDYSPASRTPAQAIAGNTAPMGLIGDVVTGLVPFTDDVLVVGCDSSIFMFKGDPAGGGSIDLVTRAVGMAWGEAWCQDPFGTIYFLSNRCGIYRYVPGQLPVRISRPVEQQLAEIDTGRYGVRLIWNDRSQTLNVYVTALAQSAPATHLIWEERSGAWFNRIFANNDHNPLVCCTFDGNEPDDRVVLIGSWDGYVRAETESAEDDDGYPIETEVWIGPLQTKNLATITLHSLQALLAKDSGDVQWEIFVGSSPEQALVSERVRPAATWRANRNNTNPVNLSGHAVYIRITSSNRWAMEAIRAHLTGRGLVRMRGAQ